MTLPPTPSTGHRETLGELFSRLIEDGKRYGRAEFAFYKQLALGLIAGVRTAAILLVLALFLVQASLTTLLIGIGLFIARLFEGIGAAGGAVIAAVIGLVISSLLAWLAIARVSAASAAAKAAGQ